MALGQLRPDQGDPQPQPLKDQQPQGAEAPEDQPHQDLAGRKDHKQSLIFVLQGHYPVKTIQHEY